MRLRERQPAPQEQSEKRRRGLLAGTAALAGETSREMVVMPMVQAWVDATQVMAFLDTGASHSLVNPQIVDTLQKEVTPLGSRMTFRWIGGDYTCDAKGIVKGLRVRIASYITHYDFYVVDMGFDVVLGLDFLRPQSRCGISRLMRCISGVRRMLLSTETAKPIAATVAMPRPNLLRRYSRV